MLLILRLPFAIAFLAVVILILFLLYSKFPIYCNHVAVLEGLLRIDLADVEIIDIQHDMDVIDGSTDMTICIRADAKYLRNKYFARTDRTPAMKEESINLRESDIEMLKNMAWGLAI